MEFTFLLLHNFPVMILARDEERPIKINKREAAWALIPLSSEYFTYKNNQTSQYIIGQSVQNTSWKVRVYGTVFTYESLTYQKSNKGANLRIRLVTYTVNRSSD